MENKVYLIIGASSDMGTFYIKSLNAQLEREQKTATVIAHYATNQAQLEELQKQLSCVELCMTQADLSMDEDIQKLIENVKNICVCPDFILHMPASRLKYNRLKQICWESIKRDLEIQVHSLAEVGKAFLPLMSKRGNGKVAVMLTSCTLGMPPKFMSEYVVVKYALLGLMKSMAAEYADKGININGISPNMVETKFLEEIDEKIIAINRENCAMKRIVSMEEVIKAIQFLLSDGSDYMNGVNLNLSGGDK